ncbi:hypothetical protein NS506_02257 [Nocardia seriolae]|uniref:Uncharacterized protein n=1 Tax=Nocardia seriolae TaxID=37332 RepID=A0ABC8AQ88_9NOCA|nr:hypothetical protein NS506_02257 [Nocardia seriolae]
MSRNVAWPPEPDALQLADRSDERKRIARMYLGAQSRFEGTAGRVYHGILDGFHGEPDCPWTRGRRLP